LEFPVDSPFDVGDSMIFSSSFSVISMSQRTSDKQAVIRADSSALLLQFTPSMIEIRKSSSDLTQKYLS
jgi:hypothetical protein